MQKRNCRTQRHHMTYEEQQRKIVEMTLLNRKLDKSEPCNLAFGIGEWCVICCHSHCPTVLNTKMWVSLLYVFWTNILLFPSLACIFSSKSHYSYLSCEAQMHSHLSKVTSLSSTSVACKNNGIVLLTLM